MSWPIRGLIEGFYGRPWTWGERIEVARWCADRGMTHYVYAPKDDPKHRHQWREPYGPGKLDGFRRLVAEGGLSVGFAISPGLDIDQHNKADRRALGAKVDQVLDQGITLVMLALDDLPTDQASPAGRGTEHGKLTAWLHHHLAGRANLVLVPTDYTGSVRTPYLEALVAHVPDTVPIGWTGEAVVNDHITAEQARRRSEALGGRSPLLWDNYPVNDTLMADRLFLGPLWGREPELAEVCSGYLANAAVQPRCSLLPLASVAAWLAGGNPVTAWAHAADEQGWRTFAEACDDGVPRALVAAFAEEADGPMWATEAAPLLRWLQDAATCAAPGLEGEAGPWLEQCHAEAQVGLAALRLIRATRPHLEVGPDGSGRVRPPNPDRAVAEAFGLAMTWPALRQSPHTVMGVRVGFRPMLSQAEDGRWVVRPGALQEDANAVDQLVRIAFAELQAAESRWAENGGRAGPVEVLVEGEPVTVADDGTFTVAPGSVVLADSAGARTVKTA